jgi:hypothetical protein
MNNFEGLYDIRDYDEKDKSFIMATFLRGLYYGNSWFNLIPKHIFMTNYKVMADVLVGGSKTVIKVACLKEDPNVILGYSILSNDYQSIVWVFVKTAWRKQGIASSLLPKYPTSAMHLTELGKSLMSKFPNLIFNPFL